MTEFTPEIAELAPQHALAVRGEVAVADISDFFGRAFATVAAALESTGAEIVGPPFGFYPEMPTSTVVLHAGFPVSKPVKAVGDAEPLVLQGGRVARVVHIGPYDTLEQTYGELLAWMSKRSLQPSGAMWESYLSDPSVEPDPASWRTMIICPVT